jgi:hypothetical protein
MTYHKGKRELPLVGEGILGGGLRLDSHYPGLGGDAAGCACESQAANTHCCNALLSICVQSKTSIINRVFVAPRGETMNAGGPSGDRVTVVL